MNTLEIWKDIPGYEGKYQASNLGRIRSLNRIVYTRNRYNRKLYPRMIHGRILRPGVYCKSGHISVVLGRGTNGIPVHQLVAFTFIGPRPKGMDIRHKNGNPKDNRLENLEYGTRRENILDAYKDNGTWKKLNVEAVEAIRFGLASGLKGVELANMFNVSTSTISMIKRGRVYEWL